MFKKPSSCCLPRPPLPPLARPFLGTLAGLAERWPPPQACGLEKVPEHLPRMDPEKVPLSGQAAESDGAAVPTPAEASWKIPTTEHESVSLGGPLGGSKSSCCRFPQTPRLPGVGRLPAFSRWSARGCSPGTWGSPPAPGQCLGWVEGCGRAGGGQWESPGWGRGTPASRVPANLSQR